jgi:hypothetical protein
MAADGGPAGHADQFDQPQELARPQVRLICQVWPAPFLQVTLILLVWGSRLCFSSTTSRWHHVDNTTAA